MEWLFIMQSLLENLNFPFFINVLSWNFVKSVSLYFEKARFIEIQPPGVAGHHSTEGNK